MLAFNETVLFFFSIAIEFNRINWSKWLPRAEIIGQLINTSLIFQQLKNEVAVRVCRYLLQEHCRVCAN